MEDYKILIYLVLSILYFLFKGRGKKKKPVTRTEERPQANPEETREKRKPKSFEELLAELSGDNQSNEQTTYSDDDEISSKKDFSKKVDKRPLNQEVSKEEYENADDTLKELYRKGEKLKSIDELVDIKKIETQSSRFAEFEVKNEENTFAKEIREGLSDPENAKKAIVYAEILNRKY
ncbi:hypothetical protein [Marivirga sp.]|uniref:hypothetical protein n=1 Tax=Marivirga sp. TaxID=2018662 RepID=UPI002D7FD7D9|nr:hypothetical protein [Marivirga sp.]HET8859529.1 hypothetical protein [Marivirga sp.]